jgi:hypothetical protein
MISSEASMMAVARLVLETICVESFKEYRRKGKISWTQRAMRISGSFCRRSRAL